MTEPTQQSTQLEYFLGILFWWNPNKEIGVLADLTGQTWFFKKYFFSPAARELISIFPTGWEPATTHSRKHRIITAATIIVFSVDDNPQVISVSEALTTEFSKASAKRLRSYRKEYDKARAEQRRMQVEKG